MCNHDPFDLIESLAENGHVFETFWKEIVNTGKLPLLASLTKLWIFLTSVWREEEG